MPRQLSLDETAAPLVPDRPSLRNLKEAAAGCTACPLHETGTQTVFGEGSTKARVVFVGEQPGDQEDLQGKPFVGPAGKLLDKALEDAGIDRSQVYVTNVVKHFKWRPAASAASTRSRTGRRSPCAGRGSTRSSR